MLRQWVAMQERRAEPLYMPSFVLICAELNSSSNEEERQRLDSVGGQCYFCTSGWLVTRSRENSAITHCS